MQVNRLFCKPICKPDAAGQAETGETQKVREDFAEKIDRGQQGDQGQPETAETAVIWLITQGRLATPRCASMRPRRRAITARESADGALREACSLAPVARPAQIARRTAATALIALGFRSEPFHDPFHE